MKNKVAVLGDGGWGTTLAILLAHKGCGVTLWSAFSDYAAVLDKKRINRKFLPEARIPAAVRITADLREALFDKEVIIFAVPSEYLGSVLAKVARHAISRESLYVSVIKGIQNRSLKRMTEVIHGALGNIHLSVLAGPTIAHEVVLGVPTTAVVASHVRSHRIFLQNLFMTDRFRIYTSDDIIGVEMGGSLKNVIAIACGISDGLGFGSNTKAGLVSRGLAEISRLGAAMGAKVKTFSGISGLGDLVTTCFSPYSRNRCVGEQIGKGVKLSRILGRMQMVAEGVPTAKAAFELSRRYHIAMPITEQVYAVLYRNKSPIEAVSDLMKREKKAE